MIVLWLGVAYALGLLAARVGLPPLVGYLAAGFALHAVGVGQTPGLAQFAEAGVLLLLFTVGLKLRLASLARAEVLGVGLSQLLLNSLLVGAVLLIRLPAGAALWVALALAFSSTVLAVKLLEDRREIASFHGRTVVGILIVQDVVAVALLAASGHSVPSPWAMALLALPLLRPLVFWVLSRSGHAELMLLFGLLLALAGGEAAQQLGVSRELGALLLGAVLAGHPQTSELSRSLWGLKEAFLVAFFVSIGLAGLPPTHLLPWALLLLLALPLKGALFFWLFTRVGLRARTAFVGAAALTSYGEFALILAVPLAASGHIPADWAALLTLTVALSLALAAPLGRASHALFARFEGRLLRFERASAHPDAEPTSLGGAGWLIVGMGRTGAAAYKLLHARGEAVVGLDSDPDKLERQRARGRRVLYGDAEDPALWEQLNLSRLRGVLLTMPEVEAKLLALDGLRRRAFAGTVAATSYHHEEDPLLQAAGATLVFRPFAEAGERLAERVLEGEGDEVPSAPLRLLES